MPSPLLLFAINGCLGAQKVVHRRVSICDWMMQGQQKPDVFDLANRAGVDAVGGRLTVERGRDVSRISDARHIFERNVN